MSKGSSICSNDLYENDSCISSEVDEQEDSYDDDEFCSDDAETEACYEDDYSKASVDSTSESENINTSCRKEYSQTGADKNVDIHISDKDINYEVQSELKRNCDELSFQQCAASELSEKFTSKGKKRPLNKFQEDGPLFGTISISDILRSLDDMDLAQLDEQAKLLGLIDEGDGYRMAMVEDSNDRTKSGNQRKKNERRREKKGRLTQSRIEELSKPRQYLKASINEPIKPRQKLLSQDEIKRFCQRMQTKENVRIAKVERKAAEQIYKNSLDIMVCPQCGKEQAYSEMIKKKNCCSNPDCHGAQYAPKNVFSMEQFEARMLKSRQRRDDQIMNIQKQRERELHAKQYKQKSRTQVQLEKRVMLKRQQSVMTQKRPIYTQQKDEKIVQNMNRRIFSPNSIQTTQYDKFNEVHKQKSRLEVKEKNFNGRLTKNNRKSNPFESNMYDNSSILYRKESRHEVNQQIGKMQGERKLEHVRSSEKAKLKDEKRKIRRGTAKDRNMQDLRKLKKSFSKEPSRMHIHQANTEDSRSTFQDVSSLGHDIQMISKNISESNTSSQFAKLSQFKEASASSAESYFGHFSREEEKMQDFDHLNGKIWSPNKHFLRSREEEKCCN